MRYWEMLHDLIDTEPPYDGYRNEYGNLAALGIAKGQPFAPDERMTRILPQAAQIASAQMRVQSLADRRPDRVVWEGRRGSGRCCAPRTARLTPTATSTSKRARSGSTRPRSNRRRCSPAHPEPARCTGCAPATAPAAYLDGGRAYKLSVPLPVPDKLFWSITVYDAETRTEIVTDQRLSRPALARRTDPRGAR